MSKITDFSKNPLLLIDFYKAVHHDQYPRGITKLVSYLTPRTSRINGWDNVVMFGLQPFIIQYLIGYFNEYFFDRPEDEVVEEYCHVLDNTLGKNTYDIQKVIDLHRLGYLPIEIKAIDEGTIVPIKVPLIEISNTHPDYAWLVNTIESVMSAELWHGLIAAYVGKLYRDIVNKYYEISVDNNVPRNQALGLFSFRGEESLESAVKSSAGWCLSFLNTATVPTFDYFKKYYNSGDNQVIKGAISTEHSVMCSNTAVDGNEVDLVRRFLTDIYKDHSFSMVSDSYDYWNMVDNIIPSLKKEILDHNGCLLVRGDSGDPVDIVTNTVFHLWNTFGGTINSKGFKVLDPHVKAIYGDSITPKRCREIYEILIENGFACNNVSLGVGSFSMECFEEVTTIDKIMNQHDFDYVCKMIYDKTGDMKFAVDTILEIGKTNINVLSPFTRDTLGIAVKATYCEINGVGYEIFKNPRTDTAHFKKSQKGMCYVSLNNGVIECSDGYTPDTLPIDGNLLKTVFKNGEIIRVQTLSEVRDRLNRGEF